MLPLAFLLKRHQPEALHLCRILVRSLEERGQPAVLIRDTGWPEAEEALKRELGLEAVAEDKLPDLRLLVVLGGDGTLLHGASLLENHPVPVSILGVNLGHLGFLTACSPERAVTCLHSALSGELPTEERHRLVCEIRRGDETLLRRQALNEVVLSQPQQARLFELDATVDGAWVTTYKADGLIISTPTGSTAYNLAAGGPILTPQLSALVLTPICPHALTARPLVAPLRSAISVRPGRGAERLLVTLDGQITSYLSAGESLHVTCAEAPIRLHKAHDRSFFDVLRVKLHWGVRE